MKAEDFHVKDAQLLLYASGEVDGSVGVRVRHHLAICLSCQSRFEKLQAGLADFSEAHRQALQEIPPADASRAGLISRLSEVTTERGEARRRLGWARENRKALAAGFAVAACLLTAVWLRPIKYGTATLAVGQMEEPDLRLTPGATVPVTESDVCGGGAERGVPAIPVSMREKVFELYGVTAARPDQYEVDYLITPELGGATDIRNLWPEPYRGSVWNAHVKDQLEDRLHRMVCHGDVDLATAQRDLSTDWIGAYRKYFHADAPISDGSTLNPQNPGTSCRAHNFYKLQT